MKGFDSKSEEIRFKYGKSRWGLSYSQIAEEFNTCISVVWRAINAYKGVGKGYHVKNLTSEERSRIGKLGAQARIKMGINHQWTPDEARKWSRIGVQKRLIKRKKMVG